MMTVTRFKASPPPVPTQGTNGERIARAARSAALVGRVHGWLRFRYDGRRDPDPSVRRCYVRSYTIEARRFHAANEHELERLVNAYRQAFERGVAEGVGRCEAGRPCFGP